MTDRLTGLDADRFIVRRMGEMLGEHVRSLPLAERDQFGAFLAEHLEKQPHTGRLAFAERDGATWIDLSAGDPPMPLQSVKAIVVDPESRVFQFDGERAIGVEISKDLEKPMGPLKVVRTGLDAYHAGNRTVASRLGRSWRRLIARWRHRVP